MSSNSNLKIIVVGAGIVGLTTANLIQDSLRSAHVTVAAENFLTDTTSDGAAGLYKPSLEFYGPTYDITLKWMKDSYRYYDDLLTSDGELAHLAGIKRISGFALSTNDPQFIKSELAKACVDEYRFCTEEELKDFPVAKYGTYYTTILTECRRYLPYLTKKFKARGGVVTKWNVNSFQELAADFDLVFNCSGLGSRKLCNDYKVLPVRGQVIKVNAPWLDKFVYLDYDAYVIPGIEAVTLGGIRQLNNLKKEVDTFDRGGILQRCAKIVPSIKHAEIIRDWVGFRPFRHPVRVEPEVLTFDGMKPLKIVHNYGHGGYGVMSAPGTSMYAVSQGLELLKSTKSRL